MARAEVEGIKREAGIERESRIAVLFIVIFGSLFTLLALFAQLMALKSEHGIDRNISIAVSVSTILLSWMLIHTVFALFYAHEFHSEGKDARAAAHGGGLDFPDDSTPDYLDFLYFSFVVGTTAQTSDVAVTLARHAPRGDAARHLVVLLQHRGDRSRGQPRRTARAGLAHVGSERFRLIMR